MLVNPHCYPILGPLIIIKFKLIHIIIIVLVLAVAVVIILNY